MNWLALVLRVLSALATVYMILCIVRIFMSWLPGMRQNPAGVFIGRIVDPYLEFFRRMRLFQAAGIDFSPIAAFAVLSAVSRGLDISSYGVMTLGKVLVLIVDMIWALIGFLVGFFALLILLRIIAYLARWNSLHPAWRAVDAMLNPVLFRIKRLIYRNRIVNYMQGLITGFLVLIGVRVILGILVSMLVKSLQLL